MMINKKIRGERQETARSKVEHRQRKTEGERESLGYSKIDKENTKQQRKEGTKRGN